MSALRLPAQSVCRQNFLPGVCNRFRNSLRGLLPLFLLGFILLMAGCSGGCEFAGESPPCLPRIARMFRCDDYDRGECRRHPSKEGSYEIEVPVEWLTSWRRLGQYMYFHSRITPGLRVDLELPLGAKNRSRFEEDLRCTFTLGRGEKRVAGILEGARVDRGGEGFWCFDYLGELLLKYHKKFGTLEQHPDPAFFPARLHLGFQSSRFSLRDGKESTVDLRWGPAGSKN